MLVDYLGQSKILQLIKKSYTWPRLKDFVIDYIKSCNIYIQSKTKYHRPYRFLKQLPIFPQP